MKQLANTLFLIVTLLLVIPGVLSLSNESIQAKIEIDLAEKSILDLLSHNIPISRANDSYQDAYQLYTAQLSLEEKGRKAAIHKRDN